MSPQSQNRPYGLDEDDKFNAPHKKPLIIKLPPKTEPQVQNPGVSTAIPQLNMKPFKNRVNLSQSHTGVEIYINLLQGSAPTVRMFFSAETRMNLSEWVDAQKMTGSHGKHVRCREKSIPILATDWAQVELLVTNGSRAILPSPHTHKVRLKIVCILIS